MSSEGGGHLSVLRGNGDGTLQDAEHSYVEAWLMDISMPVGDFDRDGKLDLLMRDGTGNRVVVLRGNGDGTFQRTEDVAVGTTISTAVVGDINADGKLDIVVMRSDTEYSSCDDYGCYDPVTTRSARVLLGYGDGSFAVPAISDLGTLPGESFFSSAVLGDFDGDGFPDLAASDYNLRCRGRGAQRRHLDAPAPAAVHPRRRRRGGHRGQHRHPGGHVHRDPVGRLPQDGDGRLRDVRHAAVTGGVSDYQAASGTLTFAPGQTSQTITVQVNGDRLGEADETFGVILSSADERDHRRRPGLRLAPSWTTSRASASAT